MSIPRHLKDSILEELGRLYNSQEDVDALSTEKAFKLIELIRGNSLEKHRTKILEMIFTRRHHVIHRIKLAELKAQGGMLSSEEEEESDDDSSSSSSASVPESERGNSVSSSDTSSESSSESSSDSEDDSDDQGSRALISEPPTPIPLKSLSVPSKRKKRVQDDDYIIRKMRFNRNRQSERRYLPYVTRTQGKRTPQPLLGSCGTIVDNARCPAFQNFITSATSGRTLVHAEGDTVVATPLLKSYTRISREHIVRSGKLDHQVFQLAQLHHPSGAWFALRGEFDMTLCGFNSEEGRWDIRDLREQWQRTARGKKADTLVHISPSHFEPGRIAVLRNESLLVWDIHDAIVPELISSAPDDVHFNKCAFGNHPSTIFVSTPHQLMVSDTRRSKGMALNMFTSNNQTSPMLDSDILTFARVPYRRDELLVVTEGDMFLCDMRSPGRYICRESHAIKFSNEECTTEIAFGINGSRAFVWSTNRFPNYGIVGPLPSLPSLDPGTHRERVEKGAPMQPYEPYPAFRPNNPLTPWDEVRGLDSLVFNVQIPKLLPRTMGGKWGVTKFIYESDLKHFTKEPTLNYILGVGFTERANTESVALLGTTYDHIRRKYASHIPLPIEPSLVLKEIDIGPVL